MFRSSTLRTSATSPIEDGTPVDWTIVLAGGEGVRLQEYVTRRFGRRIPKQYCCLLGKRSMLEHTLDRLNLVTPPRRTLTVIGTSHADFAMTQLDGRSDHVFRQPSSRDTGVALYVALAMIKRWAPRAIVTITPADHYVTPAAAYVEQVRGLHRIARHVPDLLIVLGATPTEPDPELGYLVLGDTPGTLARRVVAFAEKPPLARAAELVEGGALLSTMVTCATLDAWWALGCATQPRLIQTVDALAPLVGTVDEDDAISYVYRTAEPVSFSHDIAAHAPDRLAAVALSGVRWSDWGGADQIEATLAERSGSRAWG